MKKSPTLLFCLAMDAIGMLTFTVPYYGEFGDILWAPLSAIIFYVSFGGKKGALGAMFNFMEEILPFLDFIPTFTIAWLYNRYIDAKQKEVSLKPTKKSTTVIDI
jgi:hypothetical protein